jgi:NitT/TauT family transport system ATP-binding protein
VGAADYIRIEGLSKHFGAGREGVLALKDIACTIRARQLRHHRRAPAAAARARCCASSPGLLDYDVAR